MKKTSKWGRWIGIGLAITLLVPVGHTAQAMGEGGQSYDTYLREGDALAFTTYDTYTTYRVTLNGEEITLSAKAIDGRVFVPLFDFVNALTPAKYSYDKASGYATLTAEGLVISAGNGGTFITANDRPLYGVGVNRMIDGTLWVPLSVVAKACSIRGSVDGVTVALSGRYKALAHAKNFYREDEVYWLSRIISSESKGESLRGQLAVGNVVMNRVRSSLYPNTVYSVIFEKGQFTPVMTGTIHESPSWLSVVVAKMCLEGYAISNDILFFCNPKISQSHWVENHRPYAFAIGRHAFYY